MFSLFWYDLLFVAIKDVSFFVDFLFDLLKFPLPPFSIISIIAIFDIFDNLNVFDIWTFLTFWTLTFWTFLTFCLTLWGFDLRFDVSAWTFWLTLWCLTRGFHINPLTSVGNLRRSQVRGQVLLHPRTRQPSDKTNFTSDSACQEKNPRRAKTARFHSERPFPVARVKWKSVSA